MSVTWGKFYDLCELLAFRWWKSQSISMTLSVLQLGSLEAREQDHLCLATWLSRHLGGWTSYFSHRRWYSSTYCQKWWLACLIHVLSQLLCSCTCTCHMHTFKYCSYVVSEFYLRVPGDCNWRHCVADIHIFVNGPPSMLPQLHEVLGETGWLTWTDGILY